MNGVGTGDMATFLGIISLSLDKYDPEMPVNILSVPLMTDKEKETISAFVSVLKQLPVSERTIRKKTARKRRCPMRRFAAGSGVFAQF